MDEIDDLIATAKRHLSRLTHCCGYNSAVPCHRCVTSRKIVDAWRKYEDARVNDWPDEITACEKCGSLKGVGRWGVSEECWWSICEPCQADSEGFTKWLATEFEKALDESPEFERLPDGKYREVEQPTEGDKEP